DDLNAILSVYRQCDDFLALCPEPVASMEMVQNDIKLSREHSGTFCGIFLLDGKMIGVIDVVPEDFDKGKGVSFIALLMVAKTYRNHNIGTQVVTAVENDFRKNHHCNMMRLGVMVNNPKALRFWQRLGYHIYEGPMILPDKTTVYHLEKRLD
ncbi:MAG: GNAT family N-acetyltransferase, partial [Dehalococcoidales bacterium]|nr:GNAT family N-acetyltransferase [Dehalococcoidales bacterium]